MYKNKIGIILIIVGISVISYGAFLDNSKISKESEENTNLVTAVTDSVKSENFNSLNEVNKVNAKVFDSSASLKVGTKDFKLEFNKGEVLYDSLKRLQTKDEIVLARTK